LAEDTREGALSVFKLRTYRNVWLASTTSNFGGQIQAVGAAWLMTSLTDSAHMVAAVWAVGVLPMMLFTVFAGAAADRFNRRTVMLIAQTCNFTFALTLAIFGFAGWITPATILIFTFLASAGGTFTNPAWQAAVRQMAPRAMWPAAISMTSIGFNLARSTGPALGGVIVATLGAFSAFAVNACTYIPLLLVLLRWKPEPVERPEGSESFLRSILVGIRYARQTRGLQSIMLRSTVFALAGSVFQALTPLMARDLIGGGARSFGLLAAAFGVGAVFGAYLCVKLRRYFSNEWLIRLSFTAGAVAALITGFNHWLWLGIVAQLCAGFSWMFAMSTQNVVTQLATPMSLTGRVMSLQNMCTFGGMVAGAWGWGFVAERFGPAIAYQAAAATLALGFCIGFFRRIPDSEGPADTGGPPVGRV
jgi:MFS family permease